MKKREPITLKFNYNVHDLQAIAVRLLFVIIEEEDWEEGKEPTDVELGMRLSRSWILSELKSRFRNNGLFFAEPLYDEITASPHGERYEALSKVADARVAVLFKE